MQQPPFAGSHRISFSLFLWAPFLLLWQQQDNQKHQQYWDCHEGRIQFNDVNAWSCLVMWICRLYKSWLFHKKCTVDYVLQRCTLAIDQNKPFRHAPNICDYTSLSSTHSGYASSVPLHPILKKFIANSPARSKLEIYNVLQFSSGLSYLQSASDVSSIELANVKNSTEIALQTISFPIGA